MNNLNIALVQAPFKVGDISGNTVLLQNHIDQAKRQGAHMVVFPELAITGYPPEDLLLRPSMQKRVQHALDKLKQINDIVMIIGHPSHTAKGHFNAASVIYNGQIFGEYHKQCLPHDSVFDEPRYFDAGNQSLVFAYQGKRIALLICEDIWEEKPIDTLRKQQIDLLIVINASPFESGKQTLRRQLIQTRAHALGKPVIYVNLVGGQDDLLFDGGSLVVNPDQSIAFEAPRFDAHTQLVTLDAHTGWIQPVDLPAFDFPPVAEVYQALVYGLRDYVNHCGFNGVVLGLSGGIDSALSLAIAVDALGAERVNAVMMPYEYTAQISVEDAETEARRLGVHFAIAPIHPIIEGFKHTLAPFFEGTPEGVSEENLQARARGTLLMALSNKFNHMVLTTGNKSEMAVGYATLYGDMVGGFNALKDVYKTQVYELARFRNSLEETPVIPVRVIERAPSAELRPNQTDQDSLPPYPILDTILHAYIEQNMSLHDIVAQAAGQEGFDVHTVKRVIELVDRNEYKRKQSAPGTRVSNRAFTRERRYPIVNGWTAGE